MGQPADHKGALIAGRYRIEASLGAGAMGAVYRAVQEPLRRSVAVKLLSSKLDAEAVARERFAREAQTLSRLSHPNVVVLHDFGEHEGALFLVMEEVRGCPLRALMEEAGAMPWERAARLGWGIARGLAAAHAEGIVHADLKPENVMVVTPPGEPEQVKLLDFGLARLTREPDVTLTAADQIVGTPRYLSPEQIEGRRDEPRSDLYALGVVLFEMLSGAPPFDAKSAAALLVSHLKEPPVTPSARGVELPRALDQLVLALLSKDPDERPADAGAVLEVLGAALRARGIDDGPSGPRPPRAANPPISATESAELSWPPSVAGAPTGEVTLVFTDIQGSSRLWDRAPAVMRAALAQHDEVMRAALAAHGGYEVKTQGDAFMIAFSGPAAAVAFAVDVQERLLGADWPSELLALDDAAEVREAGELVHRGLRVRMGVYAGSPEARPDPNTGRMDYFGPDVNRAARVEAAADGGQVLVGGRLARGEGIDVPLDDLGEHTLKGITEEVPLAEVRAGPMGRRSFAPPKTAAAARMTNLVDEEDQGFIGRDADLGAVKDALQRSRLVTLLGPGGTGKTRLSLQHARAALQAGELPGGAWFADLTEARSAVGVVHGVARALGVVLAAEGTLESMIGQVGDALAARGPSLVVFDNFEQVVEHGPTTVGRWLEAAPEVRFLVTSRVPLDLGPEQRLELGPLDLDAAVALFCARADLALDDPQRPAIEELVDRLDGMPLAIELAAARARVLSPAQISARLEQRLDLLKEGRRDRGSRQNTLRGAIDWSWDLLSDDARAAFAQCAAFSGGFSLEAVEAVLILPGQMPAIDALQQLREHSLLRTLRRSGCGALRFGMYETIRAYAEEKLAERADRAAVWARHADHFLDEGERWAREVDGQRSRESLDHLSREQENLLAIWRRFEEDEPERSLRAALSLYRLIEARNPAAVRAERLDDVLALAGRAGDARAEARALLWRAALATHGTSSDEALEDLQEARELAEEVGDELLCFEAYVLEARLHSRRAAYEDAVRSLEQAEPYYRRHRRSEPAVRYLMAEAYAALGRGEFAEGLGLAQKAARAAGRLGNRQLEALQVNNAGIFASIVGDAEAGRAAFLQALDLFADLGNSAMVAMCEGNLGVVSFMEGDLASAEDYLRRAVAGHAAHGGRLLWATDAVHLATVLLEQGKSGEAACVLDDAWEIVGPQSVAVREQGNHYVAQAFLAARAGDEERARAAVDEAMWRYRSLAQGPAGDYVIAILSCLRAEAGGADDEERARCRAMFEEARPSISHVAIAWGRMLDKLLAGQLTA